MVGLSLWGFLVGFIRESGLPVNLADFTWNFGEMGLNPYDPPTVEGWKTNEYWRNSQWLLARINRARDVINRATVEENNYDFLSFLSSPDMTAEAFMNAMLARFDISANNGDEQWTEKLVINR